MGAVAVLAAGFTAAACLLTGLQLQADGAGRPEGAWYQATRAAWLLAAVVLTALAAFAWARARPARPARAALVGVASTVLWTVVAVAAGWEPVR